MRFVGTTVTAWLRRCAENVAAAMLTALFVAFLVQIFMRYALNSPIGWSTEVCVLAWLWVILWGSALVLGDSEEISFDIVYLSVGRRVRRLFQLVSATAIIALYAISLPATIEYITFMKVERSAYLELRFDFLFSIYILFVVATILRYGSIIWRSLRGNAEPSDAIREAGSDP